MSQTNLPSMDTYLEQQTAPPQELVLDPQFGSIRMVTPIGRLCYVNLATPKQVRQADGSMGDPQFSATVLLNPNTCQDIYRAIVMVASHRFAPEQRPNPQNPNEMIMMTAEQLLGIPPRQGGLHYPLRAGNESYMREPKKYEQWRGLFFLNTSIATKSRAGQSQQPVCKDESGRDCDPSKFYSGCYGRLQLTFFAFPKQGQQGRGTRGVGIGLNAVQFARHGEKMSTFDASKAAESAFAAAGAIAPDPTGASFGPNAATPASVPPGVGFAAPPAQQPQAGWAQPGAPIPPNQNPVTPGMGTGAARPPGV